MSSAVRKVPPLPNARSFLHRGNILFALYSGCVGSTASAAEPIRKIAAASARRVIVYSTDRTQLNLRYDHHHQQPQQQGHYDKLDPFRRTVREPAQHLVEATHGQPPIKQVLRNNNAMGERQQPTNSGLLAT